MSVLTVIAAVVDVSVNVEKPKRIDFDFLNSFSVPGQQRNAEPAITATSASKYEGEREGVNTIIDFLYVAFICTINPSCILLFLVTHRGLLVSNEKSCCNKERYELGYHWAIKIGRR